MILPLDLTDINSLPEKVKQVIDTFGHIDILVNNGMHTSFAHMQIR